MKTALLIHAHPASDSFVSAMRDTIAVTLSERGYAIMESDLYAMRFNPVLSADDFGLRRDEEHLNLALEQRHNYQNASLSADLMAEIDKVSRSDLIVFTFPLFWFNVPAIMKGWIDRVFISGPFYGGKSIYARAGMAGKMATAAFSLGGRSDMFGSRGIHGELVEGFMRSFFQGSLGYVGMDVIEPFVAYHIPYLKLPDREAVLRDLADYFAGIEERRRIALPDLTQFGERFERL